MSEESVPEAGPIEVSLLAELAEMSAELAPRRFALCVLDIERDDGVILGWGLALDDTAVAYLPAEECGRPQFMAADSPGRLPRMLSHGRETRLIWIDAPEAFG